MSDDALPKVGLVSSVLASDPNPNSVVFVRSWMGLFALVVLGCNHGQSPSASRRVPTPVVSQRPPRSVASNVVGSSNNAATLDENELPSSWFDGATTSSIGSPSRGRLVGGVALPLRGKGFAFAPGKQPERRYGTVELVASVVLAAGQVAERFAGSTLWIGDLSLPEGGAIAGHATHQCGRDVDVRFYLLDGVGSRSLRRRFPSSPTVLVRTTETWPMARMTLRSDSMWSVRGRFWRRFCPSQRRGSIAFIWLSTYVRC